MSTKSPHSSTLSRPRDSKMEFSSSIALFSISFQYLRRS